ncbi:MAG TPA: DmsC/YnfH family molybdoenzyme membrane anchor subunit, partial [Albitalea sp.]
MTRADGGGFGPDPWRQAHWDWRAAGNFMGGGAGSGLIAVAALSGARGTPLAVALLAGLVLVGAGLLCVWLEIGRPWRAMNVFRNPRTSWMSREAIVAALLVPAALAAAAGVVAARPLAALLALAFLYCQSRILRAARGIPAWRAPQIVPLVIATGLAEGAGLAVLLVQTQLAAAILAIALIGRALAR